MTTHQIEARTNIILPRMNKLISAYPDYKTKLNKYRCSRLIETLKKEYEFLESEYRKVKHYEFKMEKFLREIPTCRLN